MILTEEEINDELKRYLFERAIKGYAIRINGKTFMTDKRKMLWNTKSAASLAFRNALEWRVKGSVRAKLLAKGYTEHEVYSSEEYRNAWNNFKKYLEDKGIIQIIEVEW